MFVHKSRPVLIAVSIACSMPFAGCTEAQLKSVGKKWPRNQFISINAVDHSTFNNLLQKYVDEDGMVNYAAWKKSKQDRTALKSYLSELSKADPDATASRAARLSFWINAYNAVTLEGILAVYPTTSIRKHTGTFGYNIWKSLKLHVGDEQINLNDIEHKILRKMNEPRIHFAIVCASIGCPRLLNEAYVAEELENQLVANSTDFFSRSQNLRFDAAGNKLQLSAIMKWFAEDFGADTNAQIKTVKRYFPDSIRDLVSQHRFSVGYLDYNWNLNEQK